MNHAWKRGAIAALSLGVAMFVVACSSSKSSGPRATSVPASPAASLSPDATELATIAAGSPAAKLSSAVLVAADYPPGFVVKRQQTKIVAPSDVPGLLSSASGFFATSATPDGNDFVNVIAIAVGSDTDAAACLQAFTPGTYLPGLTNGAPNATSKPETLTGAPPGAKAFSYAGTVTANQNGKLTQHDVAGVALAFVHGRTFVVVVGGAYASTSRTADVTHIAAAIDARLGTATG